MRVVDVICERHGHLNGSQTYGLHPYVAPVDYVRNIVRCLACEAEGMTREEARRMVRVATEPVDE